MSNEKKQVILMTLFCLTSIAIVGILNDKSIDITIHLGGSNNELSGIEVWISPDAHMVPDYPEAEPGDFEEEELIQEGDLLKAKKV